MNRSNTNKTKATKVKYSASPGKLLFAVIVSLLFGAILVSDPEKRLISPLYGLMVWLFYWVAGIVSLRIIEALWRTLLGEPKLRFDESGGTFVIIVWPIAAGIGLLGAPLAMLIRGFLRYEDDDGQD